MLARIVPSSLLVASLFTVGCDKQPAATTAATAAAATAAKPAASVAPTGTAASPPRAGARRFTVESAGEASFLIDAPLEKIRGRARAVRGFVDVDAADLTTTKGELDVDLDALATETFEDSGKNASQTDHAHNWLEIGKDVAQARRDDFRWTRFVIASVDAASPGAKLADVPATGGERTVAITASGSLRLHGVESKKTAKLRVTFGGDAARPTSLRVVNVEPVPLSLAEHDVKPRDLAGRFLNGALEKVGKKIDDRVLISLDVRATAQ